jgi:hypothetical protein
MTKKRGYEDDEEARATKELLTYDAVFPRREFETLLKKSDLPRLLAERFTENQYYGNGSEELKRLAKEYLRANLPEAIYIITGLTLLKAHAYAKGKDILKPRVDAWNAEALRQIHRRDATLLLRSGKGARLKWDTEELFSRVKWAVGRITNPRALSLPRVAEIMNRSFPDIHLTADSLRRLLARKGVDWKKLKASRVKEIKKRVVG